MINILLIILLIIIAILIAINIYFININKIINGGMETDNAAAMPPIDTAISSPIDTAIPPVDTAISLIDNIISPPIDTAIIPPIDTAIIPPIDTAILPIDTSWNIYMPIFEQYYGQYTDNLSEFYEKINTYFSNISTDIVARKEEIFVDIVNRYTSQLIHLLRSRLTRENICNILIIGAIDGENNAKKFIPLPQDAGKTINWIYCDIGLIQNASMFTNYNFIQLYIKYILDTTYSQIFSNFKDLYLYTDLHYLFDYITFDGGVLGDLHDDTIITIETLTQQLYPLLKPNGKIYLENISKSIQVQIVASILKPIPVVISEPNTNAMPIIILTKSIITLNGTNIDISSISPPLNFEATYNKWIENNDASIKRNGFKINISYIKNIIQYKRTYIDKYVNPLMEDGGNGYTIGISFS